MKRLRFELNFSILNAMSVQTKKTHDIFFLKSLTVLNYKGIYQQKNSLNNK
jgi:hypothetical protein